MLEIQIKVRWVPQNTKELRLCGELRCIGSWNLQKALALEHLYDDEWQLPDSIQVTLDKKFEFKLFRVTEEGTVQWETLPNNSNRKFRPKYHSRLMLNWSNPEGKIINTAKNTYRVKGLPGVMVSNRTQPALAKKESEFDPYKIAAKGDSSSEEEDEEFAFLQKKPKYQLLSMNLNTRDIEEIYYESTPIELYAHLYRKKKVYIVTRTSADLTNSPFVGRLLEEVEAVRAAFYVKWIYTEDGAPSEKKLSARHLTMQKNLSIKSTRELKELEAQNHHMEIENLASENSYFVFLDLRSAVKAHIQHANSCLLLPDHVYEETIDSIEDLEKFKFICFEDPAKNREFYEFLCERKRVSDTEYESDMEAKSIESLEKTAFRPNLFRVLEELEILKFSKPIKLDTTNTLTVEAAISKISQPNSTIFVEDEVLLQYPKLFEGLLESVDSKSLIIVLSEKKELDERLKAYFENKKIIFVYDNLRKFLHEGKYYEPMTKHYNSLEYLRVKINFWISMYGGELLEPHSSGSCSEIQVPTPEKAWLLGKSEGSAFPTSFVFSLNADSEETYKRIETELSDFMRENDYFKVVIKEDKIKLTWSLNPEIRLLRTLCRTKYINNGGKLGDFQILSCERDLEEIKDELRLLLEFRSEFYLKGQKTLITSYSIGKKLSANYVISTPFEKGFQKANGHKSSSPHRKKSTVQ